MTTAMHKSIKLIVAMCLALAIAGCGVPANLPECNRDAPANIAVQAIGYSAGTAMDLASKHWVNIHADSGSGLVTADCHLSAKWV
jgi:predicted small lipoprotein YifL